MHILILGARAPACLEWARACHTAGSTVHVADSLRWPLARFSRAAAFHLLPAPRQNPEAWAIAVANIVTRHAIDLVLPTCEEAFYLSHTAEQIPARCFVAPFDLMHALHQKYRFALRMADAPIRAPESFELASAAALGEFIGRHDTRDWVFKPAYSRFASRTRIAPTPNALADLRPTPQAPWVAQRRIAGRECCSYSLLVAGHLTAHACYRPRYRAGHGAGIWFEPLQLAAIRTFVAHFGASTGYTGQVGFDFIEDTSGRFHVIECNPRATSGVHLFADQPHALVQALFGNDATLRADAVPRQVALAMLLFAAPRNALKAGFWRDLWQARDVVCRRGDVAPLLAQPFGLAELGWRAARQRCGLLTASTADIEWNGDSLSAMPGASRCS